MVVKPFLLLLINFYIYYIYKDRNTQILKIKNANFKE